MKLRPTVPITLLTLLALLAPRTPPAARGQAGRPLPARARHGMVASASELASQVGVEALKRGGNAVDAAVAVGLALAVTHPTAGNLGGGGFMLLYLADKGGQVSGIDFREKAPEKSTPTMFLTNGEVDQKKSDVGELTIGVPGTVRGF